MTEAAAGLRLEGLAFSYPAGPAAVTGVDLELAPGALFCLLGPSGCGKSTLLRLIGGHLEPAAGRIWIGDRDVSAVPAEGRDIGMVFQSYALFPHLSARGNVAFGLEMRGVSNAEIERRVEAMFERVGLEASARERRPRELSGGQQQRVALARALVIEPRLLLLDEPLANLDRRLREQMRSELRDLQRRLGVTTVLVTHDQEEALALADRVGLMMAGSLVQIADPETLYRRPRTPSVARFVGDADLFRVADDGPDRIRLEAGGAALTAPRALVPGAQAGDLLLVRPESWRLTGDAATSWPAQVLDRSFHGAEVALRVQIDGGPLVQARVRGAGAPSPDARVQIGLDPDGVWRIPESDLPVGQSR